MERKGWLLTLILPTNYDSKYLQSTLPLTKKTGFLATYIDVENDYLYLVFDTIENAKKARTEALEMDNIALVCGKMLEVCIEEKIFTKEHQDKLKKENILNSLTTAVKLEKLKHDGILPS